MSGKTPASESSAESRAWHSVGIRSQPQEEPVPVDAAEGGACSSNEPDDDADPELVYEYEEAKAQPES